MRAASCARAIHHDTPEFKSRGGATFCDFTVTGRKSWPLTLSRQQAKHWKPAKTKPPARHCPRDAVPGKPNHHQHGRLRRRDASKPLERRRNNAIRHGRRPRRAAILAWATSAGLRRRMSIAASRKGFPSAVSHEGLPWARGEASSAAMGALAGGVESNKGVSERFSASEGKSTRVRRESPSKTPKNGF